MINIEWIPVKERLPEKLSYCYATIKTSNGELYVDTLSCDPPNQVFQTPQWFDDNYDTIDDDVIAWAPFELPEPYKEVKQNDV